jgi:hypothetical protein
MASCMPNRKPHLVDLFSKIGVDRLAVPFPPPFRAGLSRLKAGPVLSSRRAVRAPTGKVSSRWRSASARSAATHLPRGMPGRWKPSWCTRRSSVREQTAREIKRELALDHVEGEFPARPAPPRARGDDRLKPSSATSPQHGEAAHELRAPSHEPICLLGTASSAAYCGPQAAVAAPQAMDQRRCRVRSTGQGRCQRIGRMTCGLRRGSPTRLPSGSSPPLKRGSLTRPDRNSQPKPHHAHRHNFGRGRQDSVI